MSGLPVPRGNIRLLRTQEFWAARIYIRPERSRSCPDRTCRVRLRSSLAVHCSVDGKTILRNKRMPRHSRNQTPGRGTNQFSTCNPIVRRARQVAVLDPGPGVRSKDLPDIACAVRRHPEQPKSINNTNYIGQTREISGDLVVGHPRQERFEDGSDFRFKLEIVNRECFRWLACRRRVGGSDFGCLP